MPPYPCDTVTAVERPKGVVPNVLPGANTALDDFAGNFQLAVRLPRALLPWRNPVWWQFISHKLLRLVVPWALLAMLILSATLPGRLYPLLFWYQVGFYGLALLGNFGPVARQLRPAAVAASLVVLNAAAWIAFWVWISGRSDRAWGKVQYNSAPLGYSTNS